MDIRYRHYRRHRKTFVKSFDRRRARSYSRAVLTRLRPMPAYVIANVEITDPATYERYRKDVPATIEKYGGRFVVRGGATEVLEGSFVPKRIVVLEFPSVERAKAWWSSPEYRPLLELRQSASRGDLFVVAGV